MIEILTNKQWNLPEEMKPEDIIIFRSGSDDFPHEHKAVKAFWESKLLQANAEGEIERVCFICGRSAPAVKRHSITFALGRDRAKLISANDSAYSSYGLENSEISPTCFVCEQKYGQALSFLLQKYAAKDQRGGPHMIQISDVTYVYWAKQSDPELSIMLSSLSDADVQAVGRILESPFTGEENHADLNRVCILALSANKARIVVREFSEHPAWKVKQQIRRFLKHNKLSVRVHLAFILWRHACIAMVTRIF